MSYDSQHPRKKEARRWKAKRCPGGYRGYCLRYNVFPLPEMAIPEWADAGWRRTLPHLSVEELDDKLKASDLIGVGRKSTSMRLRILDELHLLDPFWRGQVRGHEGGLGKKLWREELEGYMELVKLLETEKVAA